MAVLTSTYPNIVDLMKETDPQGKLARMANLLAQTNDMLTMMPYVKANNKTHHRVTALTALPTTTERALNEGTLDSKHETAQHDEGIALLDQWASCDVKLAELSGNVNEFRARRIKTGIESMNQRAQYLSIKGNQVTSPKQFTGVEARRAAIGQQVVDCGGTVTLTSMYLFCASPETIYYVYPDGSKGGLQHYDHGIQINQNQGGTTGANMAVYKDQMTWDLGLAEEDQRCLIRLANIDTTALTALSGVQAPTVFTNIIHKMMIGMERLPMGVGGDKFWIANRTVRTGFWRLAMEKSVNAISITQAADQFGRPREVLTFMGIPILLVDQLTNDETQVV